MKVVTNQWKKDVIQKFREPAGDRAAGTRASGHVRTSRCAEAERETEIGEGFGDENSFRPEKELKKKLRRSRFFLKASASQA